jgi:heme A synthase
VHLILSELEQDGTNLNRMASRLSFVSGIRQGFGLLSLLTLMKFCGPSMAFGAFIRLMGPSREFPAWRGTRLSPIYALRHG